MGDHSPMKTDPKYMWSTLKRLPFSLQTSLQPTAYCFLLLENLKLSKINLMHTCYRKWSIRGVMGGGGRGGDGRDGGGIFPLSTFLPLSVGIQWSSSPPVRTPVGTVVLRPTCPYSSRYSGPPTHLSVLQ